MMARFLFWVKIPLTVNVFQCFPVPVSSHYFPVNGSATGSEKSNMNNVLAPYYASTSISLTLCNITFEHT